MKITHVTLMNSFCLPLLTFFLWMFAANQDAVPEPNASQQVLLRNVAGSFYLYNVDTLTVNEGASGIISGVTNNSSWVAQAFVDLNGDGDKDILMRHTNGSWFGYLIKDGVVLESGGITISANTIWQFKAAHDFNGDGTADVLLRNSSNGTWFVYLVDGLSVPASGAVNLAFNQDWKFQGVADFNGDGKGDVLLRHQVNKSWFLYALDGVGLDQSSTGLIRFALNPNWEFAAANDFTGDGKADIIMRRNDGPWWMYQADGTEVLLNENFGILALTANTAWEFQGAGDFNSDGRDDILLRHSVTGRWFIYALDGRSKVDAAIGFVNMLDDTLWNFVGFGNVEYCNFTGWIKHLDNPLFSPGETGDWSDPFLGNASVLKDSDESVNKYKMWYVAGLTMEDGEGMHIGYATSSDGINWVPYSNNPIMTRGNTWDIGGFISVHVIKDGSIYKLWYEGVDDDSTNRIGYATSTDGINWMPYSNNPVFSPSVSGSWDDEDVGDPWVIKEGSTYKMWYWADDVLGDVDQIGLAVSNDGINWQRAGTDGLVMSPNPNFTWENGEGLGTPKVIKNESGYTMAYLASDQFETVRIGMATSVDGLSWDKVINPIIDVGDEAAWDNKDVAPISLMDDSTGLRLWYVGWKNNYEELKIGLASTCK